MKQKIMPTTYFTVLLALSIGIHFVFPVFQIISFPYTLLGIIPVVFGIVMNLWTDSLFKKMKTTVKPHLQPSTFVTRGPFQISRHPMYLGMTAILAGTCILCGTLLPFICLLIFIIIIEALFIPMEEMNLETAFSAEYLAYKKKVRRWF